MAQRNYPCDSLIRRYFGDSLNLDGVGPQEFQGQLYLCAISQALWMKEQIELLRGSNSFGALIWMLNANWPTGGWSLVDWIPGGRWKPLMHILRRSLFQDVIAACGADGNCFVRNDGVRSFQGRVLVERWGLAKGGGNTTVVKWDVSLGGGCGAVGTCGFSMSNMSQISFPLNKRRIPFV